MCILHRLIISISKCQNSVAPSNFTQSHIVLSILHSVGCDVVVGIVRLYLRNRSQCVNLQHQNFSIPLRALLLYLEERVTQRHVEIIQMLALITLPFPLQIKQEAWDCQLKHIQIFQLYFQCDRLRFQQLKAAVTTQIYFQSKNYNNVVSNLLLSLFSYCSVVIGPCRDAVDVGRVQRVQNACMAHFC